MNHGLGQAARAFFNSLLGLQHVLLMYTGAIAILLMIGGALNMSKDQIAILISANLFASGIVSIIQSLGVWRFGARLSVMMGVTFAAVPPMLAIANDPELGIRGILVPLLPVAALSCCLLR